MKSIIVVLALLIGMIFGISVYLAPNDLAGCSEAPGGNCSKVDAIIAVSGGDTTARTSEAIALYHREWSDKLVFSGAAYDKTGPSNAAAMRDIAIKAGVPEGDIIIEERSETTKQNAEQTSDILQDMNVKSVILVTSGYHQRRAGLEFQQRLGAGIEIINHPVRADSHWSGTWWTTPRGWYLAMSELSKIIAFYLGGSR